MKIQEITTRTKVAEIYVNPATGDQPPPSDRPGINSERDQYVQRVYDQVPVPWVAEVCNIIGRCLEEGRIGMMLDASRELRRVVLSGRAAEGLETAFVEFLDSKRPELSPVEEKTADVVELVLSHLTSTYGERTMGSQSLWSIVTQALEWRPRLDSARFELWEDAEEQGVGVAARIAALCNLMRTTETLLVVVGDDPDDDPSTEDECRRWLQRNTHVWEAFREATARMEEDALRQAVRAIAEYAQSNPTSPDLTEYGLLHVVKKARAGGRIKRFDSKPAVSVPEAVG